MTDRSEPPGGGEELKPCPFCGGEAMIHIETEYLRFAVYCFNADCTTNPGTTQSFEAESAAIAAWNRRPLLSSPRVEGEKPVAWQYLLPNGKWSNMPGDWTIDEGLPQYTYRPLYAEHPKSPRVEEVRRLREALEETLPRYIELFEAAGLGNSDDSIAVQIMRAALSPPQGE